MESTSWDGFRLSTTRSFCYSVTVLSVVATLVVRLVLEPIIGHVAPFLFFFLAILFSAWFFGLGPGIFATVLSALFVEAVLLPSRGLSFPDTVLHLFFILTGIIISLFAAAKRTTERELRELNKQLDLRAAERTRELEKEIQQKKAAERTLHRQAQLLQLIHDAVLVRSFRTAKILFWNRGAEQLYGFTEGDALGKTAHELLRTKFPVSRQQVEATVSKSGHWNGELVQTRADGKQVVVASRWFLRPAEKGEPPAFLEINSDVTASKQAEQAAREKENLAAIGMAAAMFAHEVSNPLAGLSSSLQMLERTVKNKPGADPLFLLQQATRELHRLEVLLQEFRDLARPQLLKREPTDLSQVINEVLAFQRPLCEAAGISVELQLEPVCNLLVDSGKIRQAVLNIFKNAVEAMPHGGCLTVKAYSSDEEICLEISDTGPGIPESANVFDLFVTTKRDGTGLGLPIVRQIISAHDGTISYVSEPGQGTTFKVALPMTSETEPRHGSDALK